MQLRNSKNSIVRALSTHKILTNAELSRVGATGTKLSRMVQAGEIISVGSGIYSSVKIDPFVAGILAVAKYYPQAVVSGLTALQIYGLAQEYIQKIDVDLPREQTIRNKILNVHLILRSRFIGITTLKFYGGSIRIYDMERALCEAYILDPAGPIFYKALKRYVAMGKINSVSIQKYDQILKTKVLASLQQELADD